MEMDKIYSGFTHWKWWIFPASYVSHYHWVMTSDVRQLRHPGAERSGGPLLEHWVLSHQDLGSPRDVEFIPSK